MVYKLLLALFFGALPFCGCSKEKESITSGQIRSLIDQELNIGDSAIDIEKFLKLNEITYSFDKYNNRYQCIIRDPSGKKTGYHSIVIYISVDERKQYLASNVFDSFQGI